MATTTASLSPLMPLTGQEAVDKQRAPVGVPGGSQHLRDKNGVEARDWTNVDGRVVYRVSRPIPNPQEQAIRDRIPVPGRRA